MHTRQCTRTRRQRRHLLALGLATLAAPVRAAAPVAPTPVDVWKSPTCGCCKDWVTHMEANGFRVRVHDSGNTAVRERVKIPMQLGSCHTALVGGYAIEGHVPAKDVLRLLRERPDAIGLAVPGMPIGSPGMDGPEYGPRRDAYDVLLVVRGGPPRVFTSYR
ncbi:DUF411 domain-containing protein [Rubrivivax sp. RP6-9]|uniref:DUF411 domain-containing protein n=1 Tax=Rubrivivax sp. RP6-9 TaxID=3415750 RepID=UPI003CC60177